MESSKIFGGGDEEECQSSESGWTMYIGSPIHGDDYADHDDDDDDGTDDDDDDDSDANHDDESDDDDSMASDASSGPNNLGRTHGNESETGHGFGVPKHDHEDEEDHGDGKHSCFDSKAKEPVTKLRRKEEKKEEMVFMQGRKAKAPVHQSGAKKLRKIE
ncbi:hypothetical protein FNV43_RR20720 [Rhamnella rubrinervis]|uniref:Uncharacterized protein n=1 Tax=Rhamnella rubrinervis TaxID=2594499 RepID=A0A8K0GTN2_9ROSA|nr:hypothetical protein FNV43_RR20720 [Rhamnella rubrinervis]